MRKYFYNMHQQNHTQSFYDPHRLYSINDFLVEPNEIILLIITNTNDFVGKLCSCDKDDDQQQQMCILISNDCLSSIDVSKNSSLIKLLRLCTSQICRVALSDVLELSMNNNTKSFCPTDDIIHIT